jgi:hypothetical protein
MKTFHGKNEKEEGKEGKKSYEGRVREFVEGLYMLGAKHSWCMYTEYFPS